MANNTAPTLSPLRRFWQLLALDAADLRYLYTFAIFNGIIQLSLPLGVQALLNMLGGGRVSTSWLVLLLLVTLGILAAGALGIIQSYITEVLQRRLFARAAFDFAYRIPRFRLAALDRVFVPELMNRFFDTLTIQKGLPKILIDGSTAALQIVFGLLLLSLYHPIFVAFGLLLVVALLVVLLVLYRRGLSTSIYESKYKYKVVSWLEELARNMHTFKLSGETPLVLAKTDEYVSGYLTYRKKHYQILSFHQGSFVVLRALATAALLGTGSYLVLENTLNLGQFVAAEIVLLLVLGSSEKLVLSLETIYDVLTALDKLGTVTDLPLEDAHRDGESGLSFEEIDTAKGLSITARDVTFHFPDATLPLFQHLHLGVAACERVCITGQNGAGKGTLLHLLSGLYDDFGGTITYNGIPMQNLRLESLRTYIGHQSAKETLFEGTLLENLTMGKTAITWQTALIALESVGLKTWFETQPAGFDTTILPEGKTLPRSITQRLILARALACTPRLLVIEQLPDTMTPAETERLLDTLLHPDAPYTLLLVSNDAAVTRRFDTVWVVEEGRVHIRAKSDDAKGK